MSDSKAAVTGKAGVESARRSCLVTPIDKWLAHQLLLWVGLPGFRLRLWDGHSIQHDPATPLQASLYIYDRVSLLRLLINPGLNFGELYCSGRIDLEGNLPEFIEIVYRSLSAKRTLPVVAASDAYRKNQPSLNSLSGSRKNIHHHYDIGNAFYSLWLDRELVYTCAYYPSFEISLEDAQVAKMDLVCRKLRLQKGMKIVEAGCGWGGGLARYMARRYGVKVRAFNISAEQIAYARERARIEGLDGMIEYIEDDYRNISGKYDAFVSVGMLEHVGPDNYRNLGKVITACLHETGAGLIHTIGQNIAQPMSPWFLKRIFPGSYPPTLRELMEIFEPWNLSVLDVENLRLHYARTLEQWLERFDLNADVIEAMFDANFVRAWRLYLSGAIANFKVGDLQLFQVLFTHAGNNRPPATRSYLSNLPHDLA